MKKSLWIFLFACLCVIEFLVVWAKDHAGQKITESL